MCSLLIATAKFWVQYGDEAMASARRKRQTSVGPRVEGLEDQLDWFDLEMRAAAK
jgi:hypothetical protein